MKRLPEAVSDDIIDAMARIYEDTTGSPAEAMEQAFRTLYMLLPADKPSADKTGGVIDGVDYWNPGYVFVRWPDGTTTSEWRNHITVTRHDND